jgi:hypothetical protein
LYYICEVFVAIAILMVLSSDLLQALIAFALAVFTVVLEVIVRTENSTEPARTLSLRDYSPSEVLYSSGVESVDWTVNYSYIDLVVSMGSSFNNPGIPINHALMQVGKNNINNYRRKFIVAAEFNASDLPQVSLLNAMYSSTAYHAPPISLNLLTNAVVSSEARNKSITVINHPLEPKQVRLYFNITIFYAFI